MHVQRQTKSLGLLLLGWLALAVWLQGTRPALPERVPGRALELNRASASELTLLPGVGPRLASRIVRSRQLEGDFDRPEDVDRVPGVGEVLRRRICRHVRPERPCPPHAAGDPGALAPR